jgi:hypothetical protein
MNQQWTADWTNFNPQGEAYYASVDEKDPAKNAGVQLSKAQPNPFSGVATIRYTVPQTGPVSLKVFNVQGQLVATLVDGVRQAGVYEAELKVESKASGVYLYRYFGKGFDETHKMVLTR